MSSASMGLNDSVLTYLRSTGVRENNELVALREATSRHPDSSKLAMMQISPEQGQFMALLVEILGVRKYLEIGVFTGYSAMTVAKAMGPSGQVVALDVSETFTAIARQHWEKAGIENQIDLRVAPALESLETMLDAGEQGSFDLAFIDADKRNYLAYYEAALALVKQGGVIGIDNVLWGGSVADPMDHRPDTEAIRALNDFVINDERVSISMVPIGDGLTLARKR